MKIKAKSAIAATNEFCKDNNKAKNHECSFELKRLVYVKYVDHVIFNRTSALAMKPQVRESVGWLVYECDRYVTICWDRDAGPPTLHGGDPKASGLVVLKSCVLDLKRLHAFAEPSKESSKCSLNSTEPKGKVEYALQPKERKTQTHNKGTK